jgi:hypothetical protein
MFENVVIRTVFATTRKNKKWLQKIAYEEFHNFNISEKKLK